MPISLIIIGVSLALHVAVYAGFVVREKIVVAGAVATERKDGVIQCNARVASIEATYKSSITKAVEEAAKAESFIKPAPEDKLELIKLCNASASCRSRGAF